MEIVKEKEMQYCTSCGAINKKNAVTCEECDKKILMRRRPIVDFLKKRAKDAATGEITEKLFALIKEFLFKHLYGMILTVSVVATTTVAVVTATPYIENVSISPVSVVEQVESLPEEEPQERTEEQQWLIDMAYYVLGDYSLHRDATVYAYEDLSIPSDTRPVRELYAENNVEGYGFSGVHELLTKSIPIGIYDEQGAEHYKEGFEQDSFRFGEKVQSDLGKELYKEGFDVMECVYYIALSKEKASGDETPSNPVERERFRMTFVSDGENVYIAEDVFIDRIKGDTYDLYMKYGPNGYTE